jgi:beta-lactamase superfamily II metal-dependent hydrolase
MSIKILSRPFIIAVASTTLVSGLGAYVWQEEHRPPILEIYVFALNSGRSMFIRTPEDNRILIDGGANSEVIRELSKILPFYSRRIDVVIATNTEGKNITGLIDVIERYKIDQVYLPAVTLETLGLASSTDQIYATLLDTLKRENIEIKKVAAGVNMFSTGKMAIKALFPADSGDFAYSKASAPEILFNISFGTKSLMFLGGASNKVQKFVALANTNKTDALIVSHSALPANIAKQLIDQIHPDYLIYSKTISSQSIKSSASLKTSVITANATTSITKNKKKEIVDPLEYLDGSKRFNLKEKGVIKITSDGMTIKIEKW